MTVCGSELQQRHVFVFQGSVGSPGLPGMPGPPGLPGLKGDRVRHQHFRTVSIWNDFYYVEKLSCCLFIG